MNMDVVRFGQYLPKILSVIILQVFWTITLQ